MRSSHKPILNSAIRTSPGNRNLFGRCRSWFLRFSGLAGAWEALFAYDSIIFTLTLWKTIKERKERRVTGINIALVDLLLRDGKSAAHLLDKKLMVLQEPSITRMSRPTFPFTHS